MKTRDCQLYAQLNHFATKGEFQEAVGLHLALYSEKFTTGERIALDHLIRISSVNHGVAELRICKLVKATHDGKQGISRSTFARMLRKAQELKIIEIHHTIRENGGYGASIYSFQPFNRHFRRGNRCS
ncbi:hypothetical protein [Bacillus sp. FJAT-45037]|uniref:hypothetical protein n=1 Tax=Bacillus sp. FJAT-45037 TaxID=2011007 RepID=UPI000C244727|nr:hypothetical protein [Bacillus sp. FJAT-45037]